MVDVLPERIPDDALHELDGRLQEASRTGDHSQLRVLGYGEVTTVVGVETGAGRFAVKGLPTFPTPQAALRHMAAVERYIDELGACGVDVVHTDLRVCEQPDGGAMLYLVQPMLDPHTLGPQHFARLDPPSIAQAFESIVRTLQRAVTHTVTPDGQLSNWAFLDSGLKYLDVSTPFLREADGTLALDWRFYVDAHPHLLRPLIRHQLPTVVGRYHNLRVQLVDFLANLIKEGMAGLLPSLVEQANTLCEFGTPIGVVEVRRYYAADARTFALLTALRRCDRWVRVNVLGRPYRVLVPPKFDRHPTADARTRS